MAEPTIQSEGREAGAPATDADDRGTTGAAPATEVATPPGPTLAEQVLAAAGPSSDHVDVEAIVADLAAVAHPVEDRPYLTVTLDVVALARAMQGWATYQVTAFFDGLAKVVAEVNR